MANTAKIQDTLPITENGNGNGNASSPDGSLGPAKAGESNWGRVVNYFKREITLQHADIPIIACCLVSGICDSSAYNAWNCFVSMQTGNTIFLALGASHQPAAHPNGWVKSLVSIATFLLGCAFFAQTRLFSPKARGTLAVSFFLQSSCIIIAAALVQAGVVPHPHGTINTEDAGTGTDYYELLPLAFLAFQSGGQIVTSRLLGFNEVPTTVLTSVYCDLASDPALFKGDNVKRNRRAAAVVSILVGGIVGGWISRSSAGLSTCFWLAAAIKMIIAFSWSLWMPKA